VLDSCTKYWKSCDISTNWVDLNAVGWRGAQVQPARVQSTERQRTGSMSCVSRGMQARREWARHVMVHCSTADSNWPTWAWYTEGCGRTLTWTSCLHILTVQRWLLLRHLLKVGLAIILFTRSHGKLPFLQWNSIVIIGRLLRVDLITCV